MKHTSAVAIVIFAAVAIMQDSYAMKHITNQDYYINQTSDIAINEPIVKKILNEQPHSSDIINQVGSMRGVNNSSLLSWLIKNHLYSYANTFLSNQALSQDSLNAALMNTLANPNMPETEAKNYIPILLDHGASYKGAKLIDKTLRPRVLRLITDRKPTSCLMLNMKDLFDAYKNGTKKPTKSLFFGKDGSPVAREKAEFFKEGKAADNPYQEPMQRKPKPEYKEPYTITTENEEDHHNKLENIINDKFNDATVINQVATFSTPLLSYALEIERYDLANAFIRNQLTSKESLERAIIKLEKSALQNKAVLKEIITKNIAYLEQGSSNHCYITWYGTMSCDAQDPDVEFYLPPEPAVNLLGRALTSIGHTA